MKFRKMLLGILLVGVTSLLSSCAPLNMYERVDAVKNELELKDKGKIISSRYGGGGFISGAKYEIFYSDLEVYEDLKEQLLSIPEMKCNTGLTDGITCDKGFVKVSLGTLTNPDDRVAGWPKQTPYVYLTIMDSLSGREAD